MYIYTYIIYTYIRLHYYSLSMYIYIKQELTSCPSGVQRAADGLLAGGQQRSGTQFLLYQYNSTSTDAEGPATDVGKCSGTGPRSMTAHVNEQIAALEEDRKMLITDGTLIELEQSLNRALIEPEYSPQQSFHRALTGAVEEDRKMLITDGS